MRRASLFVAAIFGLTSASCHALACSNGPPLQSSAAPTLPGRAVYQGYTADGSSTQLYLFDFATKVQTQISQPSWNVTNPLNPQFSPNGKFITFTAIQNGHKDVFVWPIGGGAPQNLTNGGASGSSASEDPKWGPDMASIVFKQDGNIRVLAISISAVNAVTVSSTNALTTDGVLGAPSEASAPFYSAEGRYIYFVRGTGAVEAVHVIAVAAGENSETTFSANGSYAYYPAVRDYTTIIYTGWTSATGRADQIMAQAPLISGTSVYQLPFNDCWSDNSDPAPVDTDYILYSNDSNSLSAGHFWRPVLGAYATAATWDLSRIGLGVGIAGHVLGINYTAAR
jgi:Tol biopolymer transport system component